MHRSRRIAPREPRSISIARINIPASWPEKTDGRILPTEGKEKRFMCIGKFSGEDPAEEREIEGGRRRACES